MPVSKYQLVDNHTEDVVFQIHPFDNSGEFSELTMTNYFRRLDIGGAD